MEQYMCRVANREELLKRWDYLIKIHHGNNSWVVFRENAIRNFDDGSTISYLGFLNDEIICELTAYIKPSAFEGDISNPSGLLSSDMAYLAAFRTNKEYEGKGYFSKLFKFAENDLKKRGYKELSLGVGPEAVRNMEIYFHYGFREYIKTTIEHDPPKDEFSIPEDEFVNFYKKKIQ